jgi:asparaginyl-tRNA synthetase
VEHIHEVEEELVLGKNEISFERLRDEAHIRPRTKYFQSVFKVRSLASHAIHKFFMDREYHYVHSPIITGNDAEGAGEAFLVTDQRGETFFSNQGSLTVSGQLHAEGFAQAFTKTYTFGPTFRAENSHTTKHAAEF